MKDTTPGERLELGEYIVADPDICHGKVTFKGTRIFVSDVLEDLERGDSWEKIIQRWGEGRLCRAAIAEALQLARQALVDKNGKLAACGKQRDRPG